MRRLIRLACHPLALVVVCLLAAGATGRAEHEWLTVPFALTAVGVIFGILFLASGRVAFSIHLAWILVALLTAASFVKFKMKGFSLHYYDLVFLAKDPELYRFLAGSYLYLVLPAFLLAASAAAGAVLLFRADRRSNWPAPMRMGLLTLAAVLLPLTFPAEAAKDRYFYYMQGRHMSAFFVSLADLGNLLVPAALERRLQAMAPQKPFSDTVDCGLPEARPDIFFVLDESQTDPAYFPQIAAGTGFLQRFAPSAGPIHPMSVETFGGGSWITNLSVMTGLSSMDFGWRSPYLTVTLQDRLGGSLPSVLSKCGYRTVVMTTIDYSFVNEGPFMKSIGVETFLDSKDIAAPSYHLRDTFYYKAAEVFIAKHRTEDGRPLFLEIQTMFPHSPYVERLEPDIHFAGEPFSENPEASEYLRRMAVARGDFEEFLATRGAEAAGHPSVILAFGDHQSAATKPFVDALAGEGAFANPVSLAYRTFYTLTTFNHPLRRPLPDFGTLDVGYIGATVLDAAGLPMSPMMEDLVHLRDHCRGLLFACVDRGAVDTHLRRRVDSGLLRLFPGEGSTGS